MIRWLADCLPYLYRKSAEAVLALQHWGGLLRKPQLRVGNAELDGLRIHDLRHTAVALWIAAGASPKEVAVRAGHTSTSFVLDRYGHLFPESDAALRDRLDELFVPATEQRRNATA